MPSFVSHPQKRIIMVSNRLPLTFRRKGGNYRFSTSVGGLATGMGQVHMRMNSVCIGWTGVPGKLDSASEKKLKIERYRPVFLSQAEIDGFYNAFTNDVVWPLFHNLIDRLPIGFPGWETYVSVNQKFAQIIVEEYRYGDIIWVHDYHLMLVPGLVRQALPDATIGYFLHIPFPPSNILAVLPWRAEILKHMLGASLLGFHHASYVRHCTDAIQEFLGKNVTLNELHYNGRTVRLGVFPLGVDLHHWEKLAGATPPVNVNVDASKAIILSVDRLDYTKGVRHRLAAIDRLLRTQPDLREKVEFVQVLVPSRVGVRRYQSLRSQVVRLTEMINQKFRTASSNCDIIKTFIHSLSEAELAALYRRADICLVTPLRDGMNLVAKEYVSSRLSNDGVLILSEFAGAAQELGFALLVNPYDLDQIAAAILRALRMPLDEQKKRMGFMRASVSANVCGIWSEAFLNALQKAAEVPQETRIHLPLAVAPADLAGLCVGNGKHLLIVCDYDGTLVTFAARPELALPDLELMRLLKEVSCLTGVRLHMVSGRNRRDLEMWFSDLHVGLHAEHGYWSRFDVDRSWQAFTMGTDFGWMAAVRSMMEQQAMVTPGAFVEQKEHSVAWHYRMANVDVLGRNLSQLRVHLLNLIAGLPIELLEGNKVLEVRTAGCNKGTVLRWILQQESCEQLLVVGDDWTDEDLFAAAPAAALTVLVGQRPSLAKYRLADPHAVRQLLAGICKYVANTSRTLPGAHKRHEGAA